jgi:uncharacterized membrane protein YidH (DUF202 family)
MACGVLNYLGPIGVVGAMLFAFGVVLCRLGFFGPTSEPEKRIAVIAELMGFLLIAEGLLAILFAYSRTG